jgi:4-amino-4-deoxy-L-arabinose transferase-like glycosyltransferase
MENTYMMRNQVEENWITARYKWILTFLTLLALGLRLYGLDKESFWFDDSFSALIATQPLSISFQSLLEEGLHHSPLFYILLRPFASLGFSEFNIRLLPVLLGVISVPMIAELGRVIHSTRVGILVACLLVINPFHAWYSREARMYSLLFLASTGSMLFFCKYFFQKANWRNWIGMAFFTAIGLNTHHFAFYLPLIQFFFILSTFKQNYPLFRYWVFAQIFAGLSLLPWLYVVIRNGQYFASSATQLTPILGDILTTLWNFSIGYTQEITVMVLFSLGLMVFIFIFGFGSITPQKLLLLIWLVVPIVMTYLISLRLPMYVDRYLIISLPAFLLILAISMFGINNSVWRWIIGLLVISTMLLGLWKVYNDTDVYSRADWRSLGEFLDHHVNPEEDFVSTLYYQDLVSLYFYYHGQVPIKPIIVLSNVYLPEYPLDRISRNRLWLIIPYPNSSVHLVGHCQPLDLEGNTFNELVRNWRYKNINRLIQVYEFNCIRLEAYE